MEKPASSRMESEIRPGPVPAASPDHVVYRRRQEDWLSGESTAEAEPRGAARRAAIEVAKATLIARDGLTSDHSDDVGLLCTAIAGEFDMDEDAKTNLMAAAQLHDIGKVGVPEAILQKPGPLDESEWEVIYEHTVVGERILSAVPELREVAGLVRHSHEHWDGSGYPDGLAGEQIPLESRIILCADAFHAVRSPRPYRDGRSAPEAYEEIRAHSGGQFDPEVVEALGRTIEDVRSRRQSGRPFFSTRAVLGNRRLAVLLLVLTMGGSALAALQIGLGGGEEAKANRLPTPCEDCFKIPTPAFAPAPGAELRVKPSRETRATRDRGRSARSAGGGRGSAPGAIAKGQRSPNAALPRVPANGTPPPSAGSAGGPAATAPTPRVKDPGKGNPHVGPPPYGNAYGHEKRLENPHPPKPPPGLVKPKPGR